MLSGAALVIAASLSFTVLKGDDGEPLLSFSDFKVPEVDLENFFIMNMLESWRASSSELPRAESTIYQWTDTEGNLQFSNSPPPAGIEYTERKYDPNENVIPAVSTNSNDANQHGDADSIFSPGVIEKLFEDANNVHQSQTKRKNNLDAGLGQ
jgi:hypothetical protein